MAWLLLFSVFIISTCGLVYELIAGALASYLLGDSITQFSTVIGVYLFSMGIGSFLSKYAKKNLVLLFIEVEILIAIVGGSSSAILFLVFEHVTSFRIILYALVSITGTLVGLEIPILMRILKDKFQFQDLVSQVFTFDYVGALIASLLFPLILVPHLGLIRTSFFFGILNVLVAIWAIKMVAREKKWGQGLFIFALFTLAYLIIGFSFGDRILETAEASSFQDKVIYSASSQYQRIVATQGKQDFRLFLNGNLQFSTKDEYRYHEALVHPGLASIANPKSVLILGGGDGLAAREVLKYPSVESITLVDLDGHMTKLFKNNSLLTRFNLDSLNSPKVQVINDDAFLWIKSTNQQFDFAVIDFPDPSNFSLGKLYSLSFYRALAKKIRAGGKVVVQSTSPYFARKSYWIVVNTLKEAGFKTAPYHVNVPSFGEWGFVIGVRTDATTGNAQNIHDAQNSYEGYSFPKSLPTGLRFLDLANLKTLFEFPIDMAELNTPVNRLNNQILVRTFDEEWSKVVSH